jgi:hypothetical protein
MLSASWLFWKPDADLKERRECDTMEKGQNMARATGKSRFERCIM